MANRITWIVVLFIALFGAAACATDGDPISLGYNDKDAGSAGESATLGGSAASETAGANHSTATQPDADGGAKATVGHTGGAAGYADAGTGGKRALGTGGSSGSPEDQGTGGAAQSPDGGALGSGVEVYLVRGIDASTGDTSYQSFDPAEVTLEATPVIADADIVAYVVARHVFKLTYTHDTLMDRLGTIPVAGTPFVVSVDGARVFGGWFWAAYSSLTCGECVIIDPMFPADGLYEYEIELEDAYPVATEPPQPDPREDARLLDRLRADGRLLSPVPLVYAVNEAGSANKVYYPGTPERAIVDRFVTEKSPTGTPESGSYVLVELLPDAGLNQRPTDLEITGTGLTAFVSYYQDGEMVFQPDYRLRVPLSQIMDDLAELSRDLGVENPAVVVAETTYLADE